MPSQTQRRRSSRLRSSAAKKIQKQFRSRKRKIQRQRSSASRKIQTRTRAKIQGNKTRKLIARVKDSMATDNDCSICFGPMINNVATVLPCGHRFHKGCIQNWLSRSQGKCSLCRSVVTNIPYVPEGRANRTFGNVPLSQQQPQAPAAPPAILDPIQRRQYIVQRLQQIEMLEQRIEQLPDPSEMPNRTQALHIQHNARQIVDEIRRLFYEASENYQNYRNVRTNGTLDQDVTNMYYRTSDLLNRAQVIRNNATRIVDELGGDDEHPDPW